MNKIRIGFSNRFLSGLLAAVCLVSWHGRPGVAGGASFLAARSAVQGEILRQDFVSTQDDTKKGGESSPPSVSS